MDSCNLDKLSKCYDCQHNTYTDETRADFLPGIWVCAYDSCDLCLCKDCKEEGVKNER